MGVVSTLAALFWLKQAFAADLEREGAQPWETCAFVKLYQH